MTFAIHRSLGITALIPPSIVGFHYTRFGIGPVILLIVRRNLRNRLAFSATFRFILIGQIFLFTLPFYLLNLSLSLGFQRLFRLANAQKEFDDPCPLFMEQVVPDEAKAESSGAAKDKAAKRRTKSKLKKH